MSVFITDSFLKVTGQEKMISPFTLWNSGKGVQVCLPVLKSIVNPYCHQVHSKRKNKIRERNLHFFFHRKQKTKFEKSFKICLKFVKDKRKTLPRQGIEKNCTVVQCASKNTFLKYGILSIQSLGKNVIIGK